VIEGGEIPVIVGNVVGADTAALTAAQAQAESGERRRRELAPATPGVGTVLPLPSVLPAGPSVGRDPASWPAVGGGYDQTAEISATDQKAYGPARPVSWVLCDCGPAHAAQERAGGLAGHMAVFCNAAQRCRSVWYRPRHEPGT